MVLAREPMAYEYEKYAYECQYAGGSMEENVAYVCNVSRERVVRQNVSS